MNKVNCYRCDYVFHPSDVPAKEWDTEDLQCGHPIYDGACPISAVTKCPKKKTI